MKRLMQMNQRLKGSKPSTRPTRSTTTNKPQFADLMNKQAEMVKKQQARRAATASNQSDNVVNARNLAAAKKNAATAMAAGSTRPSMTDMQREQVRMATRQYKGTTGAAAASSPANLQEQIAAAQSTKMMPSYMISRKRMAKGGMTKKGKSK